MSQSSNHPVAQSADLPPLPRPCAVLWDLDGTLADTKAFHFESWAQALAEHGLACDAGRFQRSFGMNNQGMLAVLLERELEPALAAAVVERKEALFRDLLRGRVQALPGARAWLARLRGWGAAQALATSAPPANIEIMLGELAIAPFFDAVVSGYALPSKPDPAVFLLAAARVGVDPARCVVMEDAVAGVEAARRAGMRCIAVASTNPAAALAQADLVVAGWDRLGEADCAALLARDMLRS